jgi:hypothetical protein
MKEVTIKVKTDADLADLQAWAAAAKQAVDLGVKLGNIPAPGEDANWKEQIKTLQEAVDNLQKLNAASQSSASKPLQGPPLPPNVTFTGPTPPPSGPPVPPPGFHYDEGLKAFVKDEDAAATLATKPGAELPDKKPEKPKYDEFRETYTPESQGEADAIERSISALTRKRAVLESLADTQQKTNDPELIKQQQKEADALKKTDEQVEALTKSVEQYYAKKSQADGLDEKDISKMERVADAIQKRIDKQRQLVESQTDTKDPKKLVEQDRQAKELGRLEDAYGSIIGRVNEFRKQHETVPSGNAFDGLLDKVRQLQIAYREAGGGLTGFLTLIRGAALSPITALVGALGAMGAAADHALKAFMPLENAVTDLNSSLAAAGKYNEVYSESLQGLARTLERTTTVAKEEWLEALAQLTKFGADNSNIQAYSRAVENLAGLMGGSIVNASNIFARVLEGNYYGLHRYGIEVDHTKAQTEQLADIMRQLESKGAGILENRAKTLSGEFKSLGQAFHNVWEGIGNGIASSGVLQNGLELLTSAVRGFSNYLPLTVREVGNLGNAFEESSTKAGYVEAKMRDIKEAAGNVGTAFATLQSEATRQLTEIGRQIRIVTAEFDTQSKKIDEETAALKKVEEAAYDVAEAQLRRAAAEQKISPAQLEAELEKLHRAREEAIRGIDETAIQKKAEAAEKRIQEAEKLVQDAEQRLNVARNRSQGLEEQLKQRGLGGVVGDESAVNVELEKRRKHARDISDQITEKETQVSEAESSGFRETQGPVIAELKDQIKKLGDQIKPSERDEVILLTKYRKALSEQSGPQHGAEAGLQDAREALVAASRAVAKTAQELAQQGTVLSAQRITAENKRVEEEIKNNRALAEETANNRKQLREIAIERLNTNESLQPRTIAQLQQVFEKQSGLQRASAQEQINLSRTPREAAVNEERLKALIEKQTVEFFKKLEEGERELLQGVLKSQFQGRSLENLNPDERRRALNFAASQSQNKRLLDLSPVFRPGEDYGPTPAPVIPGIDPRFNRPIQPQNPVIVPQNYAQDQAAAQARVQESAEQIVRLNKELSSAIAASKSSNGGVAKQGEIDAEALRQKLKETTAQLEEWKQRLASLTSGMVETRDGFKSITTVVKESLAASKGGQFDNFNQIAPPSTQPSIIGLRRRQNQLTGDIANFEKWADRAEVEQRVKDWDHWTLAIKKAKQELETINSTITRLEPAWAEILRMAGSGVDTNVIQSYIKNSKSKFNLGADNVNHFRKAGLPEDIIEEMLNHDGPSRNKAHPAPQTPNAPVKPTSKIDIPPLPEIRVDSTKVVSQMQKLGSDINGGYAALAGAIATMRSEFGGKVKELQEQIANRRV